MIRPIALPPEVALLAVGIGLVAAATVAIRRLGPDIWVLINGLMQPR